MEEINKREGEILALSHDMSEGNKGDFTGVAFVSFETENMKQELISRYQISAFQRFRNAFKFLAPKENKHGLLINGQKIYISQAAEPGDVYWKNLHLEDKERYLRKLFGYMCSVGLLVLCAVVIYHLLVKQNDLKNEGKAQGEANDMQIRALTALLAISVVVINKILGFIIPFIAS